MLPSIASKCFLQPIAELTKHEAEISAGRFFEKFDDALAEVPPGFIDRCRIDANRSIGSRLERLTEHFFGVRRPIQIFAGKPKV